MQWGAVLFVCAGKDSFIECGQGKTYLKRYSSLGGQRTPAFAGGRLSRYKPMKRFQPLLWALFSLAVGMSAGGLQSDALREWYPTLNKPALTPPDWVFPIAWTLLYILMGLSIGLVRISGRPGYKAVTGLFLVQLALNFFWSVVFFYLRRPAAGLGILSLLLVLLLLYVKQSLPLSKIGAYLFIPYILWSGFAWYLNLFIVLHN